MDSPRNVRFGMKLASFALLAILSVSANANLILNGSFEAPILPPDACSGSPPAPCTGTFQDFTAPDSFDNWSVVGSGTVTLASDGFMQFGFTVPAQDGDQWMDLSGFGANDPVGLEQQVSTVIGDVYELSFYVGNLVDQTLGAFGVSSTVEVFVDGSSLGLFTNSGGGTTADWEQFSVGFRATSTTSTVSFFNQDPVTDNMNGLDNIVLTTGSVARVPEPRISGLLLAGLLALGLHASWMGFRERRMQRGRSTPLRLFRALLAKEPRPASTSTPH